MVVNITIKNIPRVRAMLKLSNSKVTFAAQAAIEQAGFFIEAEVVDSITGKRAEPTSVDTGAFRDSVLSLFPRKLEAVIGPFKRPIPYADALEFGTSRMSPRHHFRNSAKRNEKKVQDFVRKKINAVL